MKKDHHQNLLKIYQKVFPAEYQWNNLKGDESNRMYYPSYVPRKTEIMFKTTNSVYLSGAVPVSVPLVEKNSIFVGSRYEVYSLNLDGKVVWKRGIYDHFNRFVELHTWKILLFDTLHGLSREICSSLSLIQQFGYQSSLEI